MYAIRSYYAYHFLLPMISLSYPSFFQFVVDFIIKFFFIDNEAFMLTASNNINVIMGLKIRNNFV